MVDEHKSPDDAKNSGHARMRPRARIISLLGSELISDEAVAIVELAKNAYDADATEVRISFQGSEGIHDTLVVSDNGHGMSLSDVLSGWFEPGTINKKSSEHSPAGRIYQGAKGVGRFAAARLGTALFMETKRAGDPAGTTVLIDWGLFDDQSYLDEVEIDWEAAPLPSIEHGTALTIDLRSRANWTLEMFQMLHDRLSRLISPFHDPSSQIGGKDFAIELDIPWHPELAGRIEPHPLTRSPTYKLAGRVNSTGEFTGVFEFQGQPTKAYQGHALAAKGKVASGPFDLEIRAWDRDRTGLAGYMVRFDKSLTEIRSILNRHSGVSIYRDGFRVHPYGELGNDWLSLDTRSRQNPTMNLANNQTISAIQISRCSNESLQDRTTREGLVHNEAYASLQLWFIRALKLLEEERYALRPRSDRPEPEVSTIFEAFDLSEVVKEADQQLGASHPVARLVKQKSTDIHGAVEKLQEHYSRVMLAAGFGQLVDVVVHEIGAPLGRANRELSHLEDEILALHGGAHPEPGIAKHFKNLGAYLEQISLRRDALIPKTAGRRGRASTFSVQEEIAGNFALFEALLARQCIVPQMRAPASPLIVHMSRSALGQVIANLLDNSVYWVSRHHGAGKGGQIEVKLASLATGFSITVADNGPGIDAADRDRVFELNFSRKENGMGLGLFIARRVIEPYGRLVMADSSTLSGACFEAIFERQVGL